MLASTGELHEAFAQAAPLLWKAALFALVVALLVLVPSWYMLEVYDRVVGSRSVATLGMLTVAVLGAFVLMQVLDWSAGVLLHEAALRFERHLAPRVFDACFAAAVRGLRTGNGQPLQDLRMLRDALSSPALRTLLEAPVALVFLGVSFALHPLLGCVTLGAALVQALAGWANERATHGLLGAAQRASREAQAFADAAVRNAEVVQALGMLPALQGRWWTRQRQFLELQAAGALAGSNWQAVARSLQLTTSSALLGLAAWLMLRGEVHQGAFLILASIFGGRVLAPVVQLLAQWRTVVAARDAWKRLEQFLAAVPARPAAMPLPAPAGRLVAEHLVLAAPASGAVILRSVSFRLAAGEVLAVLGPSGAGKTSLTRALVGLWPSTGGKVRLDGADVFAWDKRELGPHVGYLPQEVELFEGTIAENIARFGPVQLPQVQDAAQRVGLHALVEALPQGYATDIGPGGLRLSGGVRQRVALARALYRQPVLVVLDEPNANLDAEGEEALARAITAGKAGGTTFVVVTHRRSVLGACDRVLVLADGTARAFGPRDEVLASLQRGALQLPARRPAARPRVLPPAAITAERMP